MTPWAVTYQAPLSMGFSRKEHLSELHFFFQVIFLIQGSNLGLLHCRQILHRHVICKRVTVLPFSFQFGYFWFFFLILLLWLGHPVLYWIKVVRLEFLFPEFIRKTVNFSPLSILLAMGLPWMAFYMLRYVSLPLQWECLSWEDIKFYQMLFLCLLWLCVFVFSFVKVIYHIDLSILNQPCDPWINLTWSWCMVFLMYYWILFANTLWRIFSSIVIRDTVLQFTFYVIYSSGFDIWVIVAS